MLLYPGNLAAHARVKLCFGGGACQVEGLERKAGAGIGVGGSAVVQKIDAVEVAERFEVILVHPFPDVLREFEAAGIARLGQRYVVGGQCFAQHAHVETGIVGDEELVFQVRPELRPELGKIRLVFHVSRPDAMHGDVERIEIWVIQRLDEPGPCLHNAPVTHHGYTYLTRAVTLGRGRFKIKRNKIHRAAMCKMQGVKSEGKLVNLQV